MAMTWSRKLIPPLVLKDGRVLETLSDAGDMILGLAEGRQRAPYWRHAAELLLYAAEIEKGGDRRCARAAQWDGFM
jgi:hypothetical protein